MYHICWGNVFLQMCFASNKKILQSSAGVTLFFASQMKTKLASHRITFQNHKETSTSSFLFDVAPLSCNHKQFSSKVSILFLITRITPVCIFNLFVRWFLKLTIPESNFHADSSLFSIIVLSNIYHHFIQNTWL